MHQPVEIRGPHLANVGLCLHSHLSQVGGTQVLHLLCGPQLVQSCLQLHLPADAYGSLLTPFVLEFPACSAHARTQAQQVIDGYAAIAYMTLTCMRLETCSAASCWYSGGDADLLAAGSILCLNPGKHLALASLSSHDDQVRIGICNVLLPASTDTPAQAQLPLAKS